MSFKKFKEFFKSKRTARQDPITSPTSAAIHSIEESDRFRWQTFDRSNVLTALPSLHHGASVSTSCAIGVSSPVSSTSTSTPPGGASSSVSSARSFGVTLDTSQPKQSLPIANKFSKGRRLLSASLPAPCPIRDKPLPILPRQSKEKAGLQPSPHHRQRQRLSVPLLGLLDSKGNDKVSDDGENDGDDEKDDSSDGIEGGSVDSTPVARRTQCDAGGTYRHRHHAIPPQNSDPKWLSRPQIQSRYSFLSSTEPKVAETPSQPMRPGDIASIKAIQIPYGRLPPSFDIVPENGPVKEQQALDTDPDPRITSVSSKPGCSSLAIQSSSRTPAVPHTASSSMAAGALTSSASIKIRQKSMRLSSKSSPTVACPNPNMKVHPDDLIESASMPDISLMSLSESARAAQDAQAAQDAGIASCSICTVQAPVPEVAAPLLSPKLASTSTTLSQTASSAAVTESSRRSVGFHSSTGNRSSRHSAHRIIYQDDLDNNRVQLPKHGDYEIVPGSSEDGLLGATVGAGGASDAGGSEEAYLAQEAQRNRVVIRPSLSTGRADIFPAGRRSNVTTPVTIGGGNGGLTVRVVHAQPSPLPRTQGAYSALPSSSYTSTARRTKASGQTGSSVPPTLKRKEPDHHSPTQLSTSLQSTATIPSSLLRQPSATSKATGFSPMSNRDCLTDNIREDIRATLLQKDTRSSLETPTFTVSDTLTANVAPLLNNDSSSLTTQSQTVPAQSPPRPRKRVIGAHNMGLSVEQWRRVGGARDLDDDTTTPISVPLQPTGMDQPLGQQEVPISNAPPLQQHSSTTNSIVQPPEASPSMEEPRPTFSHLAREYIWSLFGLCLSAPDGAPTTKASNTHAHEVSPRPAGTAKDALEAILEADNRARRRLGLPTTIQRTKPSPNTEVKPNSATVATSTHLSSPFNPGGSGGGGGSVDDENYHPYATDIIVGMAFPVYHNQQNGPNGPDWDWVIRDVAEQRHRKMQARVNQILAFDPHFFEKRDRERQDSLLARAMGGFLPNDATDRALLERVGQTTTAPKLANGPCGVDCQVQCEDQCRYQYNAATTPTSTSVPPTPSMANAMFDSEDECDDQPENESLLAEEEEHGRRHHDETDLTGNSPHMHSLSARSSDDEETDEDESDDDDEPPRPRLDKGKGRAIDDNDPQMSPEPVHYHAQLFQQSTQPAASCSSSSSAVSDHWPHSGQCPHPATCIDCTNNHQSRTETSPQHEANQQDPTNQHTEANPEDDNCGSADPQSDRPLTWMPPECTLTRWRGEPPSRVQRRSREQREQREQRELNALRIFNPIMDRIQQDQQELQKEMQMRIRHVPVQTVQSCVRYSTVDPVAHQALEVCIVDGDQSTAAAAVAEESQQPRAEPKSLYLSVPQRDDGIATPPPKSLLQARARSTIHGMSVQQASAKIRHHSSPPLYLSPSDSSACSYSSSLSTTPSPPYPSPLSSIAGGSSYDDQGPYEPYARDEATRQAIRQAHLDRLDQQKRASWRARRQRLPLLGEEYEMRKRRIAEEAAARAAAAAAAAGQQQQQLQDSIDAQEAPRLREFWTPDAPYEGDDHSYDDERRRSHRSLGKMGTLCRRVASKVATETRRALKKSFSVLSLKRRQSCKEQVKREAAEAAGAAGASTADDAVDMGGHSDDDSIPLGVLLRRNT